MTTEAIIIESLSPDTEPMVRDLIRRNLQNYEEAGTVLAATFRRLGDLCRVYAQPGSKFFVLRDAQKPQAPCIGAAGIGSLHGLPPSEGAGEVRDLVLEESYRGRGLGARLIDRCIKEARALGYKHLYLETTPQMERAQQLFMRFGFRPVTQARREGVANLEAKPSGIPCYFILEQLSAEAASPS